MPPFVTVQRDRLRFKAHGRYLAVPTHLPLLAAKLPTPPQTFDWQNVKKNGRHIGFPILGNDQVGDCYYTTACHAVQTFTGQYGTPAEFSTNAVVARYRVISHGDNGLGDGQIFPEWTAGILGPNGPHKILDELTVNPSSASALTLGGWLCGGFVWTCSLADTWYQNVHAGSVWDRATPDPQLGHAMWVTGRNADGTWNSQTWGLDPCVRVTQAGLAGSDPECLVVASLEWFDPATGYAPNGIHYADFRTYWAALGGRTLPANPFPAPGPVPPPAGTRGTLC